MDRFSRGLSLALVFSACALADQSAFAAVDCTIGSGVSYFGSEAYAAPQTPNGAGEYLYTIAGLQCSGGKVIKWTEATAWYTPDDMLKSLKASNINMKRVFSSTCKTHAVLLHDNFRGTVEGVAASSYAVANQTHFDVFAGPLFYARPAALLCPETPGIGNPDLPGTCPLPGQASTAAPSLLKADPVNLANGNSYQVEVDYPGLPGTSLHFARHYNSKTANWTHTYAARLKTSPSQILLIDTDGRESLFAVAGTTVTASPKELGRLEITASGWRYDSPRNEQLHFNAAGQLTRIDRATGTFETLVHGTNTLGVTDSLGRTLTLTFNAAKRLTGLTAGALQVAYTYNAAGRLDKATRTQGGQSHARSYHYEDAREGGWLTGITDERNLRSVTWTYDDQGRVITNALNGGAAQYRFAYNSNGSTTLTNPLNQQSTYSFKTLAGAPRITAQAGAASPNCPSSNSTFTYDARGLLKTKTDNKGYVTTFDYNARGLEESRTEAFGTPEARTVTTIWHPTLFLPATVTEPARITTYHYDEQGRSTGQTVTEH